MQFHIIGFLAAISALWIIWPYAIIFMGPVVLPKKTQAEFIRKLKLDTHRYADAIRIARRFGWHEEVD